MAGIEHTGFLASQAALRSSGSGLSELKKWAKEQYELQVSQRPKQNRYYLTLHNVWTQVIKKLDSM